MKRCAWVGSDQIYVDYHDQEWGVPVHDDRVHFEFLVLEGAQAGLSWITILKRREGYKRVYEGFDPEVVAEFSNTKQQAMLKDAGIIRNKLKVASSVKNAKVFLEIQKEFGSFDDYIWKFVGGSPLVNSFKKMSEVPVSTELSDTVSKDLKKRGMSFVGTTIIYAHLQATGVVNDHEVGCFRYDQVQSEVCAKKHNLSRVIL